MFWQKALEALNNTAQDPLVVVMFIVLVVSRLVIALRVKRFRSLARIIHQLKK